MRLGTRDGRFHYDGCGGCYRCGANPATVRKLAEALEINPHELLVKEES